MLKSLVRKNSPAIVFFLGSIGLSQLLSSRMGPPPSTDIWEFGILGVLLRVCAGQLELGTSSANGWLGSWLPVEVLQPNPFIYFWGWITSAFGLDSTLRILPLIVTTLGYSLPATLIFWISRYRLKTSLLLAVVAGISFLFLPTMISLGVAQSLIPFSLIATGWLIFLLLLPTLNLWAIPKIILITVLLGLMVLVSSGGTGAVFLGFLCLLMLARSPREYLIGGGLLFGALLFTFFLRQLIPDFTTGVATFGHFPQSEIEQLRLIQLLTPPSTLGIGKLDRMILAVTQNPFSYHSPYLRFLGPIPLIGMAASGFVLLQITFRKRPPLRPLESQRRGLSLLIVTLFLWSTLAGFSSLTGLLGISIPLSPLQSLIWLAVLSILYYVNSIQNLFKSSKHSYFALLGALGLILLPLLGQVLSAKKALQSRHMDARRVVWRTSKQRSQIAQRSETEPKALYTFCLHQDVSTPAVIKPLPQWTQQSWQNQSVPTRALIEGLLFSMAAPSGTRIGMDPAKCNPLDDPVNMRTQKIDGFSRPLENGMSHTLSIQKSPRSETAN